jgi:hypothetical protein
MIVLNENFFGFPMKQFSSPHHKFSWKLEKKTKLGNFTLYDQLPSLWEIQYVLVQFFTVQCLKHKSCFRHFLCFLCKLCFQDFPHMSICQILDIIPNCDTLKLKALRDSILFIPSALNFPMTITKLRLINEQIFN